MKICYLSDANNYHTKKWCNYFRDKGYDLHVISLNDGEIPGVKVHTLSFNLDDVRYKNKLYKLKYITKFVQVKKLVDEIKPDILHAHYASSYGILGALSKYHPFIISVWGSDVYDFPKSNLLTKTMVKYNLARADMIMSTSNVMAKETHLYTNKDIEITPFGVDTNLFKPLELNKKDNSVVIGTVKALEKKYGIEYLIRGFALAKKEIPDIKLEIAGQGSQRDNLINLCKELNVEKDVTFLGFLGVDKVVEVFNRFDIAVFPSTLDSESFGVAAVEAQACATPVIISNVGGLPEATYPGKSSLLVEKMNHEDIAKAIIKLAKDPQLRKEMGTFGREFVKANYDIKDNFGKVEELYQRIIKGK